MRDQLRQLPVFRLSLPTAVDGQPREATSQELAYRPLVNASHARANLADCKLGPPRCLRVKVVVLAKAEEVPNP